MTLIKDIPYIYGPKDGLFHYGMKMHGTFHIFINPSDPITVASYLPQILLDKLSDLSVEEFCKRNLAGFIIDSDNVVYGARDIEIWGINDEMFEIDIDASGMSIAGPNANYFVNRETITRIEI